MCLRFAFSLYVVWIRSEHIIEPVIKSRLNSIRIHNNTKKNYDISITSYFIFNIQNENFKSMSVFSEK